MDRLVCVGLNYRTAPVEFRARVDVAGAAMRSALVGEYVVLRTCYRVELYARLTARAEDARDELLEAFSQHGAERDLLDHLYVHVAEDAARHLCRVAAGLDSMVLGEIEVLGQVGAAFEESTAARTAGPALSLLFRTAISAGRRARSQTSIASNPATASSMALVLAERTLGDLRDKTVLVVGAGNIGLQTLETLTRRRFQRVSIASRTRARAVEVAARAGATAYALDELGAALAASDIVITATRAELPVVTEDTVRAAMSARDRPMVIVDLAVPADVERTAGAVPGVQLFDVDDLRAGLDEARALRLREVPKVEAIIEDEVVEFSRRYRELEVAPIVSALRRQAESLRQRELDRALGELGEIDPRVAEKIERLTRTLVTKLLHDPTVRLRERAGATDGEQVVGLVQEFFGVSTFENVESRVAVAGGEDSESTY